MGESQNAAADAAPSNRAAPARRTGIERATLDSLAQLQLLKADLEAASAKLNGVDVDALTPEEKAKWEREMDRVDLAIARARGTLLAGLSAAFEAELPTIEGATADLARSLEKLNQDVQIIESVAAVLGVVEKVITLGR